ncbi:MAG: hypothetical protein DRJ52_04170 [Thermoprotei archaeon]|nr:MAG: hypothetical protein DRJ52_04170 [Thermoprotei archaeon]
MSLRSRVDSRKLYFALIVLPALGLIVVPLTQPSIVLYEGETRFSGDEAYTLLSKIVTEYRRRVVGSEADRRIALWIYDYFKEIGLESYIQVFYTRSFNGNIVKAFNVYGIKRGEVDKYIVLIAHHDVVPWTVEGANDNAAGLAVLLELARVFSQRNTRLGVIFLSPDAEETGLWGTRFFVKEFPYVDRVVAAISIDMCAWKEAEGYALYAFNSAEDPLELCDGGLLYLMKAHEKFGYLIKVSEPVLAARLGLMTLFGTDSQVFVSKGIQAVGISDYPLYPYWHTVEDSLDKVSKESLKRVGDLLERIVLTIDLNGHVPSVGKHYYFINSVVVTWHILLYIFFTLYVPAVYEVIYLYSRERSKLIPGFVVFTLFYLCSLICLIIALLSAIFLMNAYLSLIISFILLIVLVKVIAPKFSADWRSLKLATVTSTIFTYSLLAQNYSLALLLVAPLLYVSIIARPIKHLKIRLLVSLIFPLIVFLPEAYFILEAASILGFKTSSSTLVFFAEYMLCKEISSFLFFILYFSLLVAIVITLEQILRPES